MSETSQSASVELLKLPHIAAWQIASAPAVPGPASNPIIAALPAMQRGAVWKPKQVEMLWDSIARGFPIGALLLSPFDAARGVQLARHEQDGLAEPNYHLLDGQQRSTAIALGFVNPWQGTPEVAGANTSSSEENIVAKVSAVLWVDLAAPVETSDAEFVFRVLTRSHPWGYKRNKPEETLTVKAIRDALDNGYRNASPQLEEVPAHKIPLTHVWPSDAIAPIPLVFLIKALAVDEASEPNPLTAVSKHVLKQLQALPFWLAENDVWKLIRKKLVDAFSGQDAELHSRWKRLIGHLRDTTTLASDYGVPALILPQTARPDPRLTIDPLETLFIRVNQEGTRIEGEELMYSILKSNWIDAPKFIENLSKYFTHPPRLVVLATRLVLGQGQNASETRPPATPDVSQFRRLVHGQDGFRDRLTAFVQESGKKVFEDAAKILTDVGLPGGEYALPPVLAFELAHKTPDVVFLLLAWIMRMHIANGEPTQIGANQRRKLLGFLTALSWFAPDPANAVAAVWKDLKSAQPSGLPRFFSKLTFNKALRLGKKDKLIACPLPPPEVLDDVIRNRVTAGRHANYAGFNNPEHEFWREWTRYERLQQTLSRTVTSWFQAMDAVWAVREANEEDGGLDQNAKREEAWRHFTNQLWDKKSLLLFVQRASLLRWFPDYDPTVPDQVEDKNRPWDFDHIHPQSYLDYKKIPQILKDWHGSIGNFRAWPLEANRSLGDSYPEAKLSEVKPQEMRYHMISSEDVCQASFVGNRIDDWSDWCASVPPAVIDGGSARYLPLGRDGLQYGGEAHRALICAITRRFSKLYRHWYEGLMIGELMPNVRVDDRQ